MLTCTCSIALRQMINPVITITVLEMDENNLNSETCIQKHHKFH
jgi:hypothetical protein